MAHFSHGLSTKVGEQSTTPSIPAPALGVELASLQGHIEGFEPQDAVVVAAIANRLAGVHWSLSGRPSNARHSFSNGNYPVPRSSWCLVCKRYAGLES